MKAAKEFFDFFSGIPDEKWCTGAIRNGEGQCCAVGHVNGKANPGALTDALNPSKNPEDSYGTANYRSPASINDGEDIRYPQATPKARILAALKDVMM